MHPAFVSPGRRNAGSDLVRHGRQLCAGARAGSPTPRGASPRPRSSSRRPGSPCCCPAADGALSGVLFGLEPADKPEKDRFLPGRLPGLLPAGTYRFANAPHDTRLAALAFALGSYKFTRYRKAEANGAQLEIPAGRRRRRRSRASPRASRSRAI